MLALLCAVIIEYGIIYIVYGTICSDTGVDQVMRLYPDIINAEQIVMILPINSIQAAFFIVPAEIYYRSDLIFY
jgi:hypothetical protein